MDPVVLTNISDTYVSQANPNKTFRSSAKLWIAAAGNGNERYAYLFFATPFPDEATVLSAKLRVHSGKPDNYAGSVTMTAKRVTSKWAANRLKYGDQPTVTGGSSASVTQSSVPVNALWEFDITQMMQAVALGADWYGVRIEITGTAAKWIHSANGESDFRPSVEIEWTDTPESPEDLVPNGAAVSVAKPTLQWTFTDLTGDTAMTAYHVKLFSTEALADANGAGDLLDLTRNATEPMVDLDTTTYAGLADGATVWWRVNVKDGSGQWAPEWSEVASFSRMTKGNLTITNPAAAPNNFVEESTPPITWTFTGRTQSDYEVAIATPEEPEKYLWTSGKTTSASTALTPPEGIITEVGKTYRLIVRVWDTIARQAVADDPIPVTVVRDFTYKLVAAVTPVSNLTGTPHGYNASMHLEWTRAAAPDQFAIIVDGIEVARVDPEDVLVSGTSYAYDDTSARPRIDHTWQVAPVVNGQTAETNPTVTDRTKAITTMIANRDGSRPVYFFDPDVDAERAETSDVHYLLGSTPPIQISQSIRGYEGDIEGIIADNTIPGLSAEQQMENLEWFKARPGRVLRLTWVSKVMDVVIRNVSDRPIARPDGTVEYAVSLDFVEVGF